MFLFNLIYLKKSLNSDQGNAGGLSSRKLSINDEDLVCLLVIKFVAILPIFFVCESMILWNIFSMIRHPL